MSGALAAALGGAPTEPFECSRVGCRDAASSAILWRNPRIHAEDRRKTWLACDAHLAYLREFLAARDFPLTVIPVRDLPASAVGSRAPRLEKADA